MTRDSTDKAAKTAWLVEPGDAWSEALDVEHRHEKRVMGVTMSMPLVHLVERKSVSLANERLSVQLTCTCEVETLIDVTGALSVSQRHDAAFRRRCGVVAALHSCVCIWPIEVEPTSSGHSEACPAHAMLAGVMTSLKPGQCCARDIDGDGQCDMHSAPGALRSVSERDKVMRAEPLANKLADDSITLSDSTPPWER